VGDIPVRRHALAGARAWYAEFGGGAGGGARRPLASLWPVVTLAKFPRRGEQQEPLSPGASAVQSERSVAAKVLSVTVAQMREIDRLMIEELGIVLL